MPIAGRDAPVVIRLLRRLECCGAMNGRTFFHPARPCCHGRMGRQEIAERTARAAALGRSDNRELPSLFLVLALLLVRTAAAAAAAGMRRLFAFPIRAGGIWIQSPSKHKPRDASI